MKATRIATSQTHGRGLFADEAIQAGDIIGEYPLLILSAKDIAQLRDTRLYHYVFHVSDEADGGMIAAVAFGPISMCNHKTDANADFAVDADKQTVTLTARNGIAADAEIFIDYEEFATEAI